MRSDPRSGRSVRSPTNAVGAAAARAASLSDAAVLVAVVAATLWVYANVGEFGFLSYDDPGYVSQNPWVHGGLTLDGVRWSLTSFASYNWHPATWLSLMLDVSLFGLAPGSMHLMNVALHVVNLFLVHLVMRQLGANALAAGFVTALFALHPLHVESVAWISERKGLVSTAFGLASFSLYVRWTRTGVLRDRVGCALFLAAGLAAKPMLVTSPLLLLLLDWGPLERISDAQPLRDAIRRTREKLDLFALSAVSSVLTVLAQRAGGAVIEVERLGLGARIENALFGYVRYLQLTVWPTDLAVVHPHPAGGLSIWITLAMGTFLVVTTVALIAAHRRARPLAVGWLWYLISLLPVIGIVQVGGQSIAERYTYIPLLGLFAALVWAASRLQKKSLPRKTLACIGVAVLLAFTVVAERQVQHWRSSLTLFRHTVAVTPPNFVARLHFGGALMLAGDPIRALAEYRIADQLSPGHRLAALGLASAFSGLGRIDEATRAIDTSLQTDPTWAEGHAQRGVLFMMQGRFTSARSAFERALALSPEIPEAHNGLGASIASLGDPRSAIPHFERALRLRPSYAEAQRNLAAAMQAADAGR